jgi:DNA-directed RNA polymerase subunit RPC12/RpoP
MEYFEKKLTYLRGLCDGSGFTEDSKEGKVFHEILHVLEDMAFMLETFMDDEDMEVLDPEGTDEEDAEEPVYFYSFICPDCGAEMEVDEETMETEMEIPCPGCGAPIPMGTIDLDELKF